MPKLQCLNIASIVGKSAHGFSPKDLAVLHETVSPDAPGFGDILSPANYLAGIGYGIHGLNDAEGHIAWARGFGAAIFYHAGGVNSRSVGIEQVSRVMLQAPTNKARAAIWLLRNKQLRATAKMLAAWHNASPKYHPLVYSDGTKPGVTSHWDVSQHFVASEGHTDCWPKHKGGYYPILFVIAQARVYAAAGWKF